LPEVRGVKQPPPHVTFCNRCNRQRRCEMVGNIMALGALWLCRACCEALGDACDAALAHGYQK
jgi:hypothetical protein